MKRITPAAALTLLLAFTLVRPALSQSSATTQPTSLIEKVEWTWADRADTINPALPNVLLIGDSITRAYFPQVTQLLAGRANVFLFATSCAAGDPRLPGQLDAYFHMQPITFSVIHFNNGMHGWAYTDQAYIAGLPSMLDTIRRDQPGSHLVWASTTPVRAPKPDGASNPRVEARNRGAAALMQHAGIPIDDQWLLMSAHNDLHSDDVHYTPAGSQLQARQVVDSINAFLPPPSPQH